MLFIIAHHYVVNSGLYESIQSGEITSASAAMLVFGAWGKTGINCFVIITGYFMCTSRITTKKFLKLYLQFLFYGVIIFVTFIITGDGTLSARKLIHAILPIKDTSAAFTFVASFLVFYLLIPFLNILIKHLNKRDHTILLAILLTVYTILPSIKYQVEVNYIVWFNVLFIIASYIRFYGDDIKISHRGWGIITLCSMTLGALSVIVLYYRSQPGCISVWNTYFMLADCNKILALTTAVSSFFWFKGITIPNSRIINNIAATTFGVFLIHTNYDAMREWLWKDTIDCVGHHGASIIHELGYALLIVVAVFIACSAIDWIRLKYIEPRIMGSVTRLSKRLNVTI